MAVLEGRGELLLSLRHRAPKIIPRKITFHKTVVFIVKIAVFLVQSLTQPRLGE
jgi:hypothetical protein